MKLLTLLSSVVFYAMTNYVMASGESTFIAENRIKATIHRVAAGDIKTVPVRPYIKRNGTIVAPHTRSLPRKGF